MLGQPRLEVATDLLSVLAMAVSNCEEMAVLKAAEVRDGNPPVLIDFVRVAGGQSRLGGKCKLSHTVSEHLLGI